MIFSLSFLFVLILMSFGDLAKQKVFKFFWPAIFLILCYGVSSKIIEDEYRIFYFLIENDSESNNNFWQIFREKGWFFAFYTKIIALRSFRYIQNVPRHSIEVQKSDGQIGHDDEK